MRDLAALWLHALTFHPPFCSLTFRSPYISFSPFLRLARSPPFISWLVLPLSSLGSFSPLHPLALTFAFHSLRPSFFLIHSLILFSLHAALTSFASHSFSSFFFLLSPTPSSTYPLIFSIPSPSFLYTFFPLPLSLHFLS